MILDKNDTKSMRKGTINIKMIVGAKAQNKFALLWAQQWNMPF